MKEQNPGKESRPFTGVIVGQGAKAQRGSDARQGGEWGQRPPPHVEQEEELGEGRSHWAAGRGVAPEHGGQRGPLKCLALGLDQLSNSTKASHG